MSKIDIQLQKVNQYLKKYLPISIWVELVESRARDCWFAVRVKSLERSNPGKEYISHFFTDNLTIEYIENRIHNSTLSGWLSSQNIQLGKIK